MRCTQVPSPKPRTMDSCARGWTTSRPARIPGLSSSNRGKRLLWQSFFVLISLIACALWDGGGKLWPSFSTSGLNNASLVMRASNEPDLCPFAWDGNPKSALQDHSNTCRQCSPRGSLPNVFARVQQKETIKVCYIGGSVTAGPAYREPMTALLRRLYPESEWVEHNAAVRATGSDLGACRLHHDVLPFEPDLLVVEFAINDEEKMPAACRATMEMLVRTFWSHRPQSDILFVYTIREADAHFYEQGYFAPAVSAHEAVARHYGIPSVHMGLDIARWAMEGKVAWQGERPLSTGELPPTEFMQMSRFVFGRDGVHPYSETGGKVYLEAVERCIAVMESATAQTHGVRNLPTPLDPRNAAPGMMIASHDGLLVASPAIKPVNASGPLGKIIAGNYPFLPSPRLLAQAPGDTLSVRFWGTGIGMYVVVGPMSGDVVVILDDQPPRKVQIFSTFCAMRRPGYFSLASNLTEGEHTIVVDVSPHVPDKEAIMEHKSGIHWTEEEKRETTYVFAGFCVQGGHRAAQALPWMKSNNG